MNIVRKIEDGVEFFTLQETGESGISVSGLARLCGADESAVRKLLKSVRTSSAPEFLKPLQGEDIEFARVYTRSYKNAKVIKGDHCVTIIEWYAFESQRPNETAKYSYRKFARKGIHLWIQEITGWEQSESEPKQIEEWKKQRSSGKEVRKTLTDAIKIYIESHPEMSANKTKFLYSNTSDRLNKQVFGKRSRELKKERGVSDNTLLRNTFNLEELYNIKRIEDVAVKLIINHNVYPIDAINEAMDRMLIETFDNKTKQIA